MVFLLIFCPALRVFDVKYFAFFKIFLCDRVRVTEIAPEPDCTGKYSCDEYRTRFVILAGRVDHRLTDHLFQFGEADFFADESGILRLIAGNKLNLTGFLQCRVNLMDCTGAGSAERMQMLFQLVKAGYFIIGENITVKFRYTQSFQFRYSRSLSTLHSNAPALSVSDCVMHQIALVVNKIYLGAVNLDNQHNLAPVPALCRKAHDDKLSLPELLRKKLITAALRLDPFTEMKRQQSELVQRFCDFRAGSSVFFAEVRQPLDQLLSRVDAEALDSIELTDGEV